MGWDVFISHASEDKATVAVPLKRALEQIGISVWIDIDQIKLGDSFRSKIDLGLQRCRFGVIVLSPNFFRKPWAQAELDAFFGMEMSASGQKRLLPIIYGMPFSELQKHSPLLSGRLAVRWEDGINKVVEAIAEVVSGTTTEISSGPTKPASPTHSHVKLDSLVLFLLNDGRMVFAETIDVEHGVEGTHLSIKCSDPSDTALVQELAGARSDIAVAFGTTAMLGRVTEAVLRKTGNLEVGLIKLKNVGRRGGNPMEMSFAGYSADALAEMRARRILLNEQFAWKRGDSADAINQATLDMFAGGFDTTFKIKDSPIPKIYKSFSASPELFIPIARLAVVASLCLTDVVESVLKLDLRLEGTRLHVDFVGKRARKYVNVDPPLITVKGTLDLR